MPFEANMDTSKLKTWFIQEKREMPWRGQPTPYQVWISEVMLQQTQVAVVKNYYLRWMAVFPSIKSLAESSIDEVIKLWEGLGYYSRARNLHKAAQYVMEHHGGELPDTKEELIRIVGLGPYTVGAILSFAFHKRAPAVDGNVIRVLSRYMGLEEDVSLGSVKAKIWEYAEKILPQEDPWVVTEALIEIGSTVCMRTPKCFLCPLQSGCVGLSKGNADLLPIKGKKQKIETLHRQVAVIIFQDYVLLRKGQEKEVMRDLYEFPYFEMGAEISAVLGIALKFQETLSQVKHSFTRFRATLYPSVWEVVTKEALLGFEWKRIAEVSSLPFSSGHRKILFELLGPLSASTVSKHSASKAT